MLINHSSIGARCVSHNTSETKKASGFFDPSTSHRPLSYLPPRPDQG